MPEAERRQKLADLPGVTPWLCRDKNDKLRPRRMCLPPLVPATHHQKLAVFDGQKLYIGGLDLNDRRFDTKAHRRSADETWHDIQIISFEPDLVSEAHRHLSTFLSVTDGRTQPPSMKALLRTLSCKRHFGAPFLSPRTVADEIFQAHLQAIRNARQFIYIETQYFRDRRIARALARRARQVSGLRIFMVLPAAPDDVAFDHSESIDLKHGEYLQGRCVRLLQKGFGSRAFVASPARCCSAQSEHRDTLHQAPIIYVHAKVSIFDDAVAIVSSGNLNGRSMAWDTEAGLQITDPGQVRRLRQRCLDHWSPGTGADWAIAPELCARLGQLARNNASLPPERRAGFLLPYPFLEGERFASEMPVLPDEMV